MIYKTLHRKLTDQVTQTTLKLGALEGLADRAPMVTPIVIRLNDRLWLVVEACQGIRQYCKTI